MRSTTQADLAGTNNLRNQLSHSLSALPNSGDISVSRTESQKQIIETFSNLPETQSLMNGDGNVMRV